METFFFVSLFYFLTDLLEYKCVYATVIRENEHFISNKSGDTVYANKSAYKKSDYTKYKVSMSDIIKWGWF